MDVFLFGGGEVDTLEIRLYELHPVVDKFIAVTSNVTHKGEATFDALESLLQTARFESFRDKVEIFKHAQAGAAAPNGVNFQFEAEKESAIAQELAKRYDEPPQPSGSASTGRPPASFSKLISHRLRVRPYQAPHRAVRC